MTKLNYFALACLLITAPACGDDGDPAVPDAGENIDASVDPGDVDGGDDPGDVDGGDDPGDVDGGDDPGDVDGGDDPGDVDGGDNNDPPTAFRITSLELMDPRPQAPTGFGCLDATDILNGQLADAIEQDGDGDGLLDLNAVAVFRPLDQSAAQTPLDVIVGSDCTAPADTTTCSANATQSVVTTTAQNDSAAACSVLVADSTNPDYDPTPSASATPCFSAAGSGSLTIDIGGTQIELVDVAGSATYEGDPATGLINGVLRGFISEADANNVQVDNPLGDDPFILSELLLGGQGNNCSSASTDDDRDTGPGDESGWYFYLAFTAEEVPFTE